MCGLNPRKILLSFLFFSQAAAHGERNTHKRRAHRAIRNSNRPVFFSVNFLDSYNYYYYYWINFCVFYGRMRWFRRNVLCETKQFSELNYCGTESKKKKNKRNQFYRLCIYTREYIFLKTKKVVVSAHTLKLKKDFQHSMLLTPIV